MWIYQFWEKKLFWKHLQIVIHYFYFKVNYIWQCNFLIVMTENALVSYILSIYTKYIYFKSFMIDNYIANLKCRMSYMWLYHYSKDGFRTLLLFFFSFFICKVRITMYLSHKVACRRCYQNLIGVCSAIIQYPSILHHHTALLMPNLTTRSLSLSLTPLFSAHWPRKSFPHYKLCSQQFSVNLFCLTH